MATSNDPFHHLFPTKPLNEYIRGFSLLDPEFFPHLGEKMVSKQPFQDLDDFLPVISHRNIKLVFKNLYHPEDMDSILSLMKNPNIVRLVRELYARKKININTDLGHHLTVFYFFVIHNDLGLLRSEKSKIRWKPSYGRTPLMFALSCGASAEMIEFLISVGCKADAKNKNDMTVLSYAAEFYSSSAPGIFQILLNAGAKQEINTQSTNGMTPLFLAVQKGDLVLIRRLVEEGGDLHFENREGRNAAWYVQMYPSSQGITWPWKKKPTPLWVRVFDYLLSQGVRMDKKDRSGNTILEYYLEKEKTVDIPQFLISKGVLVTDKCLRVVPPDTRFVDILLQHQANPLVKTDHHSVYWNRRIDLSLFRFWVQKKIPFDLAEHDDRFSSILEFYQFHGVDKKVMEYIQKIMWERLVKKQKLWRLVEPRQTKVDQEQQQTLLQSWKTLSIPEIIQEQGRVDTRLDYLFRLEEKQKQKKQQILKKIEQLRGQSKDILLNDLLSESQTTMYRSLLQRTRSPNVQNEDLAGLETFVRDRAKHLFSLLGIQDPYVHEERARDRLLTGYCHKNRKCRMVLEQYLEHYIMPLWDVVEKKIPAVINHRSSVGADALRYLEGYIDLVKKDYHQKYGHKYPGWN